MHAWDKTARNISFGGMDSAVLALHASELDKGIKTFTSRVYPNPKKFIAIELSLYGIPGKLP